MGNFRIPPSADSFSPAEVTLKNDLLSKIQTDEQDPRVVFDSSGLWATDPTGGLVFQLDAALGSAFFKGHVHATGLDLDAGLGIQNAVRWLDANGIMISQMFANPSSLRRSLQETEAKADQGSGDSSVTLIADSDGPSRVTVSVSDDTNGNKVSDILRSDGKSNFIRTPGAVGFNDIKFGISTVQFPASDTSNQKSIAHGLNRIPSLVWFAARTPANARIVLQETQAADINNIYCTGYQTQGIAVNLIQNTYWIAIG